MALDPIPLFNKQVFGRLGEFTFELLSLTPEKIERDTAYRWVKQEPIGAGPVFSYLGDKQAAQVPHEDKWTLTGTLYPEFSGRIDHLKKIRDLAAQGKPIRLVYADTQIGQNLGLVIISKIKESRSVFYGDGIPRKIDFTLELEKYG